MLRLHPFELHHPTDLAEAIALLASHRGRARVVAGGTDLLPALKYGKDAAAVVVALGRIDGLRGVRATPEGGLELGALTTLDALSRDPLLGTHAPAVAQAAGHAASPPIRRRATLGGNLLLDVRCRYVDQSALFRQALGGCLKSHGDECHVVPGGRTCVAALCADTVAPLVAHGASVELVGPNGARLLDLDALYDADGRTPHRLAADEVLTRVLLPALPAHAVVGYRRWALRKAIDFPLLSVAVRVERDGPGPLAALAGGEVVVTALGGQPRRTELSPYAGQATSDATAAAIVAHALRRSRPLPNLPFDDAYRHERLGVELGRLLATLGVGSAA